MKKRSNLLMLLLALILFSGFGEKQRTPAVDLTVDKVSYSKGEPVKLSIKFTNISEKAISTYFPSGQKFDFIVMDAKKMEIWRWSRGKMFIMSVQSFKLEQKKSISYSCTWDQKMGGSRKQAPSGTYYVVGEITIMPAVRSSEKAINIK